MLSVVKTVLASIVVGWFASLAGDTAATVILVATVLASTVYLIKVARDAAKLIRHWIRTVQVIHAIPPWMESINKQITGLDGRLDHLEQQAQAIREPAEAVARELDVPHRHTSA